MNGGGRGGREMSNCVECSIDAYDDEGGFTSTTILIETCRSDAGSSRRSSKKSTSTMRTRRRKKMQKQQQLQQQIWLTGEGEDFFQQSSYPPTRHASSSGRARCSVKTPFSSGTAGAPYNKKLRKKNMQQQQQQRHHFSFGCKTATNNDGETSSSSFFISPTHRVVAEATTPWNNAYGTSAGRYHFFGQGGLPTNVSRGTTRRKRDDDNDDDMDDKSFPSNLGRRDRAAFGGGSRLLAPLRSPSVLPPLELLPASRVEISSELLESCLLDACLGEDDDSLFFFE
ncbi:hypothetical protein ECC02_007002 [Trypanosoma cruzi]|uniref:Uncharacterized protein n=1 Tax=Trypanosoma cruzi TaxID=5693 RepID=A0A7J6Y068_TRYCR|nr:hypothetical protein ECC02_007002 [Trypanosoma cruzi]